MPCGSRASGCSSGSAAAAPKGKKTSRGTSQTVWQFVFLLWLPHSLTPDRGETYISFYKIGHASLIHLLPLLLEFHGQSGVQHARRSVRHFASKADLTLQLHDLDVMCLCIKILQTIWEGGWTYWIDAVHTKATKAYWILFAMSCRMRKWLHHKS